MEDLPPSLSPLAALPNSRRFFVNLLRALRNDERAAKAEFSKFLQGKLSDGLLKLSRRAPEARRQNRPAARRVLTSLSHCTAMRRVPRP